MKDIFYTELRRRIEEIREIEKEVQTDGSYHMTESGRMLTDTVEQLLELSYLVRREGLFALEEKVHEMVDFPGVKYLEMMAMLVVDGTDPEMVEEISFAKYCSSRLSDYAALQYLIMMRGILAIQENLNPRGILETLSYLLPEEILDEYERIKEEKQKDSPKESELIQEEPDMSIVDRLCSGDKEPGIQPGDICYYEIKMLDEAIQLIEDRAVQRVLRDVDNGDLSYAMKGLSGRTRRIIFNNLSGRIAVMIAEDMEYMGTVRITDVGECCRRILVVLLRLMDRDEVVYNEDFLIREMANLFINKHEAVSKADMEARKSENKLYGLWDEYLKHSNRVIK